MRLEKSPQEYIFLDREIPDDLNTVPRLKELRMHVH